MATFVIGWSLLFVAFFVSLVTSQVGLCDLVCHLLYAVPVAVSAFINIYPLRNWKYLQFDTPWEQSVHYAYFSAN